ncbi:MAG: hypothetical protein NC406_01670 [Bacteroides sp.]|nr:hypothetical protein [Bacteroides sp.]MCM1094684.1 hypothetical protein [Terasakiella sp.]
MTKQIFTALALMALSAPGMRSAEPLRLVFETTDGAVHTYSADALTMTIGNGMLTVANASQTDKLDLNQLVKMYFTGEPTGITDTEAIADSGIADVFTTDGRYAGRFDSAREAAGTLSAGVYIIITGGNAYKICVR